MDRLLEGDSLQPFQPLVPPLPSCLPLAAGTSVSSASAWPQRQPERLQNIEIEDLKRIIAQQSLMLERVIAVQERQQMLPPPPPGLSAAAGAAAGEPVPMEADVPKPKRLRYKASAVVGAKLTSLAAKLRKRLVQIAKSKLRIEKFNQSLEVLASGKIPPSYKPYALPWEGEEWQSKVENRDFSMLIVPAAADKTFEEVGRKLYTEYVASCIILQKEAESVRLQSLLAEAKVDTFIQECKDAASLEKESFKAVSSETIVSDELWEEFLNDVAHEARQLYLQQVKKVAVDNMMEAEKQKKQKESEQKALDEAAKLPESEVWRRGLKEVLNSKHGKKYGYDKHPDVVSFAKLLDLNVKDVDMAQAQKPKNGESPGGGRGQNPKNPQKTSPAGNQSRPKQKAKAKPKPAAKSKAVPAVDGNAGNKGKGKGKGKDKGKGKGKGNNAHAQQSNNKGKGKGKAQPANGGRPKGR